MSENRIRKLIYKWRYEADDGWIPGNVRNVMANYASQLEGHTRPEQFMPRLDEWPGYADAVIVTGMSWVNGEYIIHAEWVDVGGTHTGESVDLDIPPGIDPRIKVSREDMKAWEATE